MGGDGGVIASNRKYLRGAGNANHTADHNREKKRAGFVVDKEAAQECMTTCAVTAKPLDFTRAIVICPYGRLYQREAALEALLRRKQQEQQQQQELQHIRGLKDFHVAQFETKRSSSSSSSSSSILPVCPLTGEELNGQSAAFFIIRSPTSSKNSTTTCTSEQQSNVLSERAIKEMGMESLQTELGPFDEDEMIRLAPPAGMMDTIRDKLAEKQKKEKQFHKSSKKDKKRKKGSQNDAGKTTTKAFKTIATGGGGSRSNGTSNGNVAEVARLRVASAVKSNSVLCSLFNSSEESGSSEKKKNDNLCAGYVK